MRPLRFRRAWKLRRANDGLRRPRPLFPVAANLMGASTGPRHSTEIFRAYLDSGADVLLMAECADLDLASEAEEYAPGVWTVFQPGEFGSPESGAAVAWRRSRARMLDSEVVLGSAGTDEGGGIRARYIARARLLVDEGTNRQWDRWFRAGHAPPARAPRARAKFMARFAPMRGVGGGDLNLLGRIVATVTGQRVSSVGVLHVITPLWVPAGEPVRIPKVQLADADHDGAGVVLWPKP